MKITEQLSNDHKVFLKFIEELREMTTLPLKRLDQNRLSEIVAAFKSHLLLHVWSENIYFYPKVRSALYSARKKPFSMTYMDKLELEHKRIDFFLEELEKEVGKRPLSENWGNTFTLFYEAFYPHFLKEENEVFPAAEKLIPEKQLSELSEDMELDRVEMAHVPFPEGVL